MLLLPTVSAGVASALQQIYNVYGSIVLSVALQVCEDWFARMRILLLRACAAANNHALALYHAYARLGDLKSQLHHLQAAAAAELAQQQQAEKQSAEQQLAQQQLAHKGKAAEECETEGGDKPQSDKQHPEMQTQPSQAPLPPATSASHQQPAHTNSKAGLSSAAHTPASAHQAPLSKSQQYTPSIPAAKSLLEIQAEQAAESAEAAAAKAAASSPSKFRNKPSRANSAHSPAQNTASQAKVLHVKRPKPGQLPAANGLAGPPKVVPLTRTVAGKVAVAETVPVPGTIKLMARPQVQCVYSCHLFAKCAYVYHAKVWSVLYSACAGVKYSFMTLSYTICSACMQRLVSASGALKPSLRSA